eukprot:GEMP01007480.1.p1 GENE.GEMP01007480.1~~GEMP01007480.1.p1  ORF type:complete len:673 (-),score=149.08 GEMP01007480.1:1459-3477(-)
MASLTNGADDRQSAASSPEELISLRDSRSEKAAAGSPGLFGTCCAGPVPTGRGGDSIRVCKDHAMMYQEHKVAALPISPRDAATKKGRTPSVTMATKRKMFDEFTAATKLIGGPSGMLTKGLTATSQPDGGADWLNNLLLFIWPRVSKVVQNAMDDLVEPAIRDAVPQIKESLEIYTNMGEVPPTLGPIKTFRDDNSCDSISIEMGISWDADLSVKAVASFLTVVVDRLKVRGTIVIKLCPLLDEIPLVGALHIYFLDPPVIDMRIKVENSPLPLSNIVRGAVDQGVRDALVLPNRILAPVAMMYQLLNIRPLHNPSPVGMLKLTVLEMRNLPAADFSVFGKGSSDPYAEVSIGAENWKCDKVSSSLNPVFKSGNVKTFFFFTHHQNVRMKVWDYDFTSGDDILGEVIGLTVEDLVGEKWFDLSLASEFRTKGDESAEKKGKACFVCKKRKPKTPDVPPSNLKEERESVAETDETAGVSQVRLLGEILTFSDKGAHVAANTECMLEVAIVGVRGGKGCKESREAVLLSVTLDDDERWTPPCFTNIYNEPTFVAKNIDPSVVHRLGQIHSVQKVADIMEISAAQVEACLRAGHEGIWCHSFYYHTKKPNGEVTFKIGEHKATMSYVDLSEKPRMQQEMRDFEIGPFLIDVSLHLTAIVKTEAPFDGSPFASGR